MSRHIFTTTYKKRPVKVIMGWDRPLQYFFMDISLLDARDEESSILYDNLREINAFPKDLGCYLDKLKELNIEVPEEMIEEVQNDMLVNAGNKIKNW